MELKSPTTLDEQVRILKSRRIIIDDEQNCKEFLSLVNYYRFSGYYLPFMKLGADQCFMDISFDRLKTIYYFDAKLRNLISGAIEDIEIYMRTQISNYYALKYGAEGYLNPANFSPRHDHQAFLKLIDKCISDNTKTLIVKHHNSVYGGHFPFWVIINFFSMGMLSIFYRDMLNRDKAYLAQSLFRVNYQILANWLHCLTDLRNKCAHYSRIYYWKFTVIPKFRKDDSYTATSRLFAQLYMMKQLYPNSQKWNAEFLSPLSMLINENSPQISLKHIDFPEDWYSLLTK